MVLDIMKNLKTLYTMSKMAIFCYCKNTYTIKHCDKNKCNAHPFWRQGIGFVGGKGELEEES